VPEGRALAAGERQLGSHSHAAMFVLIMGVTGSGKTTVGKLLSVSLGWAFFDADDFHSAQNVRKMASGVPLTDEDRRPWLQELHRLISQRIKRGESGVLACSALKQEYRSTLCLDNPVEVVYLKAQPELIQSRLQRRRGHYMPPELIESQFRDLEEPQGALVVDAALPTDQAVAIVRSRLGR
jgi:gluconokinase